MFSANLTICLGTFLNGFHKFFVNKLSSHKEDSVHSGGLVSMPFWFLSNEIDFFKTGENVNFFADFCCRICQGMRWLLQTSSTRLCHSQVSATILDRMAGSPGDVGAQVDGCWAITGGPLASTVFATIPPPSVHKKLTDHCNTTKSQRCISLDMLNTNAS